MSSDDFRSRPTEPRIPIESAPPAVEHVGPVPARRRATMAGGFTPAPGARQSSSLPPGQQSSSAPAARRASSAPAAGQRASLAPAPHGSSLPPESARSRIRAEASEPIAALFRLIRNARVHRIDNAAVLLSAEQATSALRRFAELAGRPVRLTFVEDLVFVCGDLLRAGRSTYEAAREFGQLLRAAGANEICISPGVSGHDLIQLVGAWNAVLAGTPTPGGSRPGVKLQSITEWSNPRIDVREISELGYLPLGATEQDAPSRMLELYGVSISVMRSFYADVAAGSSLLPKRVKRLAQRWVMSALSGDESFLHLTTLAKAHRGVAGRCVHSALLLLAMARLLTKDRRILGELALAALMAEVGRVKAAGSVELTVSREAESSSLEASSAVMILSGGWEPQAWLRTVATFEVAWLERQGEFGAIYAGQANGLLTSQLLVVARAYLAQAAPAGGGAGLSPPAALGALIQAPGLHNGVVRLLARALGILPTGTVVELEGGEWAIVAAAKSNASYHRPALRLVTDAEGNPQPVAVQVDLEQTSVSGIRRIVTNEQARFNTALAFFSRG